MIDLAPLEKGGRYQWTSLTDVEMVLDKRARWPFRSHHPPACVDRDGRAGIRRPNTVLMQKNVSVINEPYADISTLGGAGDRKRVIGERPDDPLAWVAEQPFVEVLERDQPFTIGSYTGKDLAAVGYSCSYCYGASERQRRPGDG